MKIKLSIRKKISLFVLVPLSVYIIVLIAFIGVKFANQSEFDNGHTSRLLSERSAAHAEIVLKDHQSNIRTLANLLSGNQTELDDAGREFYKETLLNSAKNQICWTILPSTFYADTNYQDNDWVLLQADNGNFSVTDDNGVIQSNFGQILSTTNTTFFKPYEHDGQWLMNISSPIYQNGNICGFVCKSFNIKDFDLLAEKVAQQFNEEVSKHLINENGITVYSSIFADINKPFTLGYADTAAINGMKAQIVHGDYLNNAFEQNGVPMCTYFTPINIGPDCNWSMALTFPTSNVARASAGVIRTTMVVAIIGLIMMIAIVLIIAINLAKSVKSTTNALEKLAVGDTESIETLDIKTNDELEDMSNSLNQVVDGIRKSETFALSIGKGDFDSDFHTLGNKDRLGDALIKMRDSLVESQKVEAKRKEEEELRNWATEGIAKFADILRQDQNNMKSLGYNIMSNLIDYLKVNQGALFVINNDNEDDIYYSMVTAIAYGRDKYMKKDIRVGEGLVGQCIYEHKTIYLTEVPEDYVKITSGLGTANPRCILIVPCLLNEEMYGVIEIASFNELKPYEIEFVEKLGESIASTVSSVKVAEKTAKLLQASQTQREELTSQEEELRQNLEEMQATQEDLRRQMDENQEMKDVLSKEKGLMDSLMDNINDYIYFKDLEGKFIRVSESFLKLVEVNSYDDVIGKSDFDFCSQSEAQSYFDDEQRIIKTKKPILNQIQKEHRFGRTIYTSISKYPLFDSYGNVIGTFGLTSDVTNSFLSSGARQDDNKA
ncbi:MAG: GAF domain-containing protein [Salinivirgaceae bacterium]|nr:GAF domain-containing protein [Salinivirgaceae bacterium]